MQRVKVFIGFYHILVHNINIVCNTQVCKKFDYRTDSYDKRSGVSLQGATVI